MKSHTFVKYTILKQFNNDHPKPPCPYVKDSPDYYLWMAGYELAVRGFGKPRAWLLSNQWKGWNTSRTHGLSKSSEYKIYHSMLKRCSNPKEKAYVNYGGRGIKVCDRWKGPDGFINFYSDMGARSSPLHSLDRIDVNGNYEPENCNWATRKEQSLNKRSTIYLTLGGRTAKLGEWAKEFKLTPTLITHRLYRGWSVERALSVDPYSVKNKTGYPGVYYLGRRDRWYVPFFIDGKQKIVGTKRTPLEAYRLRVEYAKLHGITLKEGYDFLDRKDSDRIETLYLRNMQLSVDFDKG